MKVISLNGKWKCRPDFNDIGIIEEWTNPKNYDVNDPELLDIEIPKSFNFLKGFETFEGIFWHFYQFEFNNSVDLNNHIYKLRIKASNYNTKVWLNGCFLGENDGGFLPFSFRIKDLNLKKENVLIIRTENLRRKERLPSLHFDWFNWGGIYRDVELLIIHRSRVEDVKIITSIISKNKANVEIHFKVLGKFSLNWQILDSDLKTVILQGECSQVNGPHKVYLDLDHPKLWSPRNPNLYYLKILSNHPKANNTTLFETYFGIRQIKVKGIHIYLNNTRIKLKGVSLHEEYMPYGRTIPYEKRKEDILNIKALGFNALRTAHYPHDESLIELADKLGILILEEIPVYQYCDFKNEETFRLAVKMIYKLIKRDFNHPSVIWWSVGNEIPVHRSDCARFIKKLMEFARRLDDTRIITYVTMKLSHDFLRRFADVATINTYFGWYFGNVKLISLVLDIMRTPIFNKPWIYTEFGAGAKYGFHADWKKQVRFSEEKQQYVLDYTIRTLNSKNYIAGWFIWIYRDFRSLIRTSIYQEGYNRKGLVSGERNEKKLICRRFPDLIYDKRKIIDTQIIGIIIWLLFFPFIYFTFRHIDSFIHKLYTTRTL
ncbi:MAG: glycoside hydrolase family 2 protein [Candidatus Hodarchaeota archaeon]